MSTRRYATVIYGYNLPVDFTKAEELENDKSVDVFIDGMSGEYFLVGKTIVNYAMDAYDDAENGVDDSPKLISLSMAEKARLRHRLTELFPEHKGLLGAWYVTRYV